jgi:phage baseplate assembly protein W
VADQRELYGVDLKLLTGLDTMHSSRDPGRDLSIRESTTGASDLATLGGVDNLVQALFLRMLTPRGDLEQLGHPTYGSRLHELVGELNNQANRNRAKMLALEALSAEPRVSKVLSLDVVQARDDRTRVDITADLEAIDLPSPLNFVFPFTFEGEAET